MSAAPVSTDESWTPVAQVHEAGFQAEPPVMMRGGRLYAVPKRVPCRECRWCAVGMVDHCERSQPANEGEGPNGFIAFEPGVDCVRAAFAQLLARAIRVARLVAPVDRALVTLVGIDALTLLTAQLLATNTPTVRVLAHDDADLARCDRWGIRHRAIADAGLRHDQDVVVLGRTTEADMGWVAGLLRPRGRIVITESAAEATGPSPRTIAEGELIVAGVRGGSLHEAAAMLAERSGPDIDGLGFEVQRGGTTPSERGSKFGRIEIYTPA